MSVRARTGTYRTPSNRMRTVFGVHLPSSGQVLGPSATVRHAKQRSMICAMRSKR